MFALLLFAQIATGGAPPDSTYASAALRQLIAASAQANRMPPPALRGYRARVESELSLLLRDTLGRESVAQVEQLAIAARWQRVDAAYDLHVIGYRSQTVGAPYSALSFARSWTVPYLYGDRLSFGVDVTRPQRSRRADASDSASDAAFFRAVHPLAADRERFYRFSGGDTVAVVRAHGRAIPIVRVRVVPHFPAESGSRDERLAALDGELDIDAMRHQIVRMRGAFVVRRRSGHAAALARVSGVVGVAFVELVNGERDERYWLPTYQRTEFQASAAALGSMRSVFRLVSRFSDMRVDEDSATESPALLDDYRRRLTFAPTDSESRFADWQLPLGEATSRASAATFDDLAPDAWRSTGSPRLEFAPSSFDDVFRYDRVEGAYTGAAVGIRFRDAAPGLSARAFGGWAWSEATARGGAAITWKRGGWITSLRGERALVSSNDFAGPLEGGVGFATLLGAPDEQDYLDRRISALAVTRLLGNVDAGLLTGEVAAGADRSEIARLAHGLLGGTPLRMNRVSDEGQYVRGRLELELHPDVTGVFLDPGIGARASYEIGRGQLNWERAELTVASRYQLSELTLAARAQGGVVLGRSPPPQSLFEIGGEGPLPGYGYKEFGGDRAATAGMLASYGLPVLRRPWRVVRSLIVPGFSPGLGAGIQAGWAELSTSGAREAMERMAGGVAPLCDGTDAPCTPAPLLSRPTGGIRATADLRLTLLGGLLGLGVARPVDRSARWRLVLRAGQEF